MTDRIGWNPGNKVHLDKCQFFKQRFDGTPSKFQAWASAFELWKDTFEISPNFALRTLVTSLDDSARDSYRLNKDTEQLDTFAKVWAWLRKSYFTTDQFEKRWDGWMAIKMRQNDNPKDFLRKWDTALERLKIESETVKKYGKATARHNVPHEDELYRQMSDAIPQAIKLKISDYDPSDYFKLRDALRKLSELCYKEKENSSFDNINLAMRERHRRERE